MKKLILLVTALSTLFVGCFKKEPINIAYIATLTGKNSELGTKGRNGIRMALKECKESGGINGRDVKLHIFNDKGDIEYAKTLIDSLKKQNISFVIGPLTSNMKDVILKGVKENILFISPTISTSKLSKKNDLFIRVTTHSNYQSKIIVDKMKEINVEKVLILLDNINQEYTDDIYKSMVEYLDTSESKISVYKEYLKLDKKGRASDFKNLVDSIKPDAIMISANTIDFGTTAQYIRKSSIPFTLFGGQWSTTGNISMYGGNAIEGAFMTRSIDKSKTEVEKEFNKRYDSQFKRKPSFIPIYTYDATKIMFDAMRNSKSISPNNIKEYIIKKGKFPVVQGYVAIDSFGDANRDILKLYKRENGKFIR